MKKLSIFLIFLLCGCSNSSSSEIIVTETKELKAKDNLNFEYAERAYLYDLFLDNGAQIISENIILDTTSLGEHKANVIYNNGLNIKELSLTYNVVDTTAPVLNLSNVETTIGKEISFLNKMMCGDNYDRNVKCEVVGKYDFNKVGTYPLEMVATDSSNNRTVKSFKLNVVEKKSSSSSKPNYYYFNDLIKKYKNDKTMLGIDVSVWQGNINWEKVKNAGCEFAMIRIGIGTYKNGDINFDTKFKQNLKNAKNAGVKVGLYFYSYAKTKEEARSQARWVIEALAGESLDLPIAFDWEIWNGFSTYKLNFYDLNEIAKAFIDEINNSGYEGAIYGSAFFMNKIWNLDSKIWLAYYTSNNDFTEKPYFMWQLSSRGNIDGINGYVDLNILYLD